MENKTDYQAELFSNRLQKKYRELRKWARKNRISCYRLYDRDIPEIPVSLDLYEFLPDTIDHTIEAARFMSEQNAKLSANIRGIEEEIKQRTFAVIYLYECPYQKDEHEEEIWLEKMSEQCCKVLGIEKSHIIKKMRKHFNHNAGNQYKKENTIGESDSVSSINGLIQEQGQLFRTDLTTYLDTGLFFDHRPLRSLVRETCSNKRVLNLFCYTGSFSVYAAQGNASYIESVDLSNTYLDWAKENMKLNGFSDKKKYVYTKTDCIRFLQEKATGVKSGKIKNEELYDLIILDLPTFSNSKSTQDVLDINRDWPQLVKDCLNILTPGGILYFSTNSERIKFDLSKLPSKTAAGIDFNCNDITYQTIPQDFERKKPHKCWQFKLV